jgi:subtilase family protein
VGNAEPRLVDLDASVEQEVEIERPRAVGRGRVAVAAEASLDREEQVEELPRRASGLEGRDPVQERRLIDDADGLRIDQGGNAEDLDPLGGRKLRNRGTDRPLAVAEVGAEPDVHASHAGEATLRAALGRRFFAACVLALCLCGAAGAAAVRIASDPLESQEWWLAKVGATPAAAPPAGVPITIVDSGTDATHPEFAGRPATTFLNGQTTAGSREYHGTLVASIAAAPENGVGIAGVYPTAALRIYDASPTPGDITPGAVTAIESASQSCPSVINLSFGGTEPSEPMRLAILKAVHNGCLVVAAAGNNTDASTPIIYPASWPHVFTVAATDQNDAVWAFSVPSAAVDIAAPGVGITGAVPLDYNSTGYTTESGTTLSAPIVSAAAAWIWTVRPTLAASQVGDLLREGARDVGPPGFDTGSGFGVLNISASLAAPAPPPDPQEPNDDVSQVKPGQLFPLGEPALTTSARPSGRIAAALDTSEDPDDLYRIWVPAHRTVRAAVTAGGRAAARIWGPQTVSVAEGVAARRRDLKGQRITAGKKGFGAYVEVLLTSRSAGARYALSVTAAKR